jgi:hypothetical protein
LISTKANEMAGKLMKHSQEQGSVSTGRHPLHSGLFLVLVPALFGQPPEGSAGKGDRAMQDKHERLLKIYTGEAKGYTIHRDATGRETLELRAKPVYVWTNPLRAGGQDGAVFVWTCRGRAELLGTFFSYPATGERGIQHELHSLATTVLDVSREGSPGSKGETWTPKVPGITLAAIPEADSPADTPAQRLAQMRAITRGFTGTTQDNDKNRWELRMLPHPFFRYESTDPDVLDGAVFAFVSSAGTDPEAILVLEARKAPGTSKPAWQFGLARFTDMNLVMRYKGKEVFSVPMLLGPPGPEGAYRIFQDRIIPPLEDATVGPAPKK